MCHNQSIHKQNCLNCRHFASVFAFLCRVFLIVERNFLNLKKKSKETKNTALQLTHDAYVNKLMIIITATDHHNRWAEPQDT